MEETPNPDGRNGLLCKKLLGDTNEKWSADLFVQLRVNSNVGWNTPNFLHWLWNSLFCPTLVKIKGCTVIGKRLPGFLIPDYQESKYRLPPHYPKCVHLLENVSNFGKIYDSNSVNKTETHQYLKSVLGTDIKTIQYVKMWNRCGGMRSDQD